MSLIDITKFDGHTAGPWHTEPAPHGVSIYAEKHVGAVAESEFPSVPLSVVRGRLDLPANHGAVMSERRANARLIAAAPDLLAEVIRLRAEVAALKGGAA